MLQPLVHDGLIVRDPRGGREGEGGGGGGGGEGGREGGREGGGREGGREGGKGDRGGIEIYITYQAPYVVSGHCKWEGQLTWTPVW